MGQFQDRDENNQPLYPTFHLLHVNGQISDEEYEQALKEEQQYSQEVTRLVQVWTQNNMENWHLAFGNPIFLYKFAAETA